MPAAIFGFFGELIMVAAPWLKELLSDYLELARFV